VSCVSVLTAVWASSAGSCRLFLLLLRLLLLLLLLLPPLAFSAT
jgi:hypothetical protein